MNQHHKRRLTYIILIAVGLSIATALVMYALRQNIDLYYTPSQAEEGEVPHNHDVRIGGMIEKKTIQFGKGLNVSFRLTDFHHDIKVHYRGVLPVLFRSGQGLVVQGQFNRAGVLIADQVLAKHDANYKPPEINVAAVSEAIRGKSKL